MPQGQFNNLRDQLQGVAGPKSRPRAGEPNSTNVWTAADEKEIDRNPRENSQESAQPPGQSRHRRNRHAPRHPRHQRRRPANARSGSARPRACPTRSSFCVGQLPEFSAARRRRRPNPEADRFRERFGKPPAKPRRRIRAAHHAARRRQRPDHARRRGPLSAFIARKGQHLVVAVSARELIPYLADAVPGWFQATLALYDAKGKELAYDDDFRFHPDPVLLCEIPKDGDYVDRDQGRDLSRPRGFCLSHHPGRTAVRDEPLSARRPAGEPRPSNSKAGIWPQPT